MRNKARQSVQAVVAVRVREGGEVGSGKKELLPFTRPPLSLPHIRDILLHPYVKAKKEERIFYA